mgnify:CR=1 FL=1
MSGVQVKDVVLQLPEYLRLIQNGANSHCSENQELYIHIEKKILECVLNTFENPAVLDKVNVSNSYFEDVPSG